MNVDLTRFRQPCACGHTHKITAKTVVIESGAIQKLPQVVKECGLYRLRRKHL